MQGQHADCQLQTILWSLAAFVAFIGACVAVSDHSLIYSLDDPYIHLALARNIQLGTYGINPGQVSSPSSSVLWPFILAASPSNVMEVVPLLINVACGICTICILRDLLRGPLLAARWQLPAAFLVAGGLNVFGIAMTGMEHSLQTLLAAFIAWRIVRNRLDAWLYAALAVGPLIRYELAGLTLPVAIYLWSARAQRIGPVLSAAVASIGLICFSAYLAHFNLPWLPSSVLAKSGERDVIGDLLRTSGFWLFLGWLWTQRKADTRAWWLLHVLPVLGFWMFGRAGWQGRYEAYMAMWLMVFSLAALQRRQQVGPGVSPKVEHIRPALLFTVMALCLPSLWICTVLAPLSCLNIQRQQAAMAELARQLARPVAVNDLGLVSWRSGAPVLDLWGLGSMEALDARLNSKQPSKVWLDQLVKRHAVQHAFIFDGWFDGVPAHWRKVGELRLNVPRYSVPFDTVSLYATTEDGISPLQDAIKRAADHPIRQHLFKVF